MHNISTAWLTTNYTCNYKCDWCYARKVLADNRYLDLEYAKQLVQYLYSKKITTITLIGGEPTIYPNFIELIQYIKKIGMKVRLATNGKRFENKNFAQQIVSTGIDGINISIKGVTEEEYLSNTHQYGLLSTIEGYKNLTELGFDPSISYVITTNNKSKFKAFVDLLVEENINDLVIQFEKPSLDINSISNVMDIRDMANFVSYIYTILEKSNINYTIEISFPICLIESMVLDELIAKNRISTCCHVQKNTGIVFDCAGRVIPCNHFAEYPFQEKPLDLNNPNAIDNLWDSNIVKKFKNTVNRFPSEKCIECRLWNVCGGGCFTRWLYIDPKKYI